MIDTHCHLTFPEFRRSVARVMDEARAEGTRAAITISTTTADALQARAVAHEDPRVVFTVGVHPLYADEPVDWEIFAQLARDARCVAFGEMGLDGHHAKPPLELQESVLLAQLEQVHSLWNQGVRLPLVIHCRKAVPRLLPILQASGLPADRMVFHCFTEGPDEARLVLDFGAWISFTGAATFKRADSIRAAALLVPADRVMVETDAPFLTPEPHRGIRPNAPKFVRHVAACLARVRGVDEQVLERILDDNAVRFFGPALQAACESP
ncbi:MAG: TatD family hydrolase [Planctomycetota bacterium]|nr:TatD family hydrolase [Planctomycetota bacterium]MDA1105682.1 TatD family hydrolase [Planctomycetota bacterium]